MQPVPHEDNTVPNMHSEANEQGKPQASQPRTDMRRDPVNPNQQAQPYPPPQHSTLKPATKLNHRCYHPMLAWGGIR